MKSFDEDLDRAGEIHGHICGGQIIGVRMARLGIQLLGIDDPSTYRDLICFVECDRCAADAVSAVTCCTLGRRRLKLRDYGKLAATFYDMRTGKAVRIAARPMGEPDDPHNCRAFYDAISDEEMFKVEPVRVSLDAHDLPGPSTDTAICEKCGEEVMDGRAVREEGHILCPSCAHCDVAYYERLA